MIKSGLFGCRAATVCNLQAYFSIRPYTREQRTIKTIEKQQQRLEKVRLRRMQSPIILQPVTYNSCAPDLEHQANIAPAQKSANDAPNNEYAALLDHDKLKKIYNLSESDSEFRLNACCSGCGAYFHGGKPGTHGFLPTTEISRLKLMDIKRRGRTSVPNLPKLCIRCQLMGQHKSALSISVAFNKYDDKILNELNNQENSTIIVVADMLNLPHSVVPLRLNNPYNHRFVLIGNKVDQLPIDGSKYYSRWRTALMNAFNETTGICQDQVSHISLVSALNGYGMNKLLDFLLSSQFNAYSSPVYIVGTTNVGKSSIFNRLLMSDFCKSEARESIHRATVSFWPGTTAGLLKFPLARMSYIKQAVRDQARYTDKHSLKSMQRTQEESHGYLLIEEQNPGLSASPSDISLRVEKVRDQLQDLSKMPTYRLPVGNANVKANELKETDIDLSTMMQRELGMPTSIEIDIDSGHRVLISGTLDPRNYNPDAWCHDTPGLESHQQTLNFLSSEQLVDYLSLTGGMKRDLHRPERKFLLPRTFTLRPGQTMLLGRLGRIDILSAGDSVYMTTQSRLPVHIVETNDVDAYWRKYAAFLGPGCLVAEGVIEGDSLPPMSPVDIEPIPATSCHDVDQSVADVVLSGAGWVSVAGGMKIKGDPIEQFILLRAWTPGAAGISFRQPALLPFAIRRRGQRVIYLREYSGVPKETGYTAFNFC